MVLYNYVSAAVRVEHENSVGSVGWSDMIIAKMDILKYNAGCVIILSIMSQQETWQSGSNWFQFVILIKLYIILMCKLDEIYTIQSILTCSLILTSVFLPSFGIYK